MVEILHGCLPKIFIQGSVNPEKNQRLVKKFEKTNVTVTTWSERYKKLRTFNSNEAEVFEMSNSEVTKS